MAKETGWQWLTDWGFVKRKGQFLFLFKEISSSGLNEETSFLFSKFFWPPIEMPEFELRLVKHSPISRERFRNGFLFTPSPLSKFHDFCLNGYRTNRNISILNFSQVSEKKSFPRWFFRAKYKFENRRADQLKTWKTSSPQSFKKLLKSIEFSIEGFYFQF